jgi:hypothetical protein
MKKFVVFFLAFLIASLPDALAAQPVSLYDGFGHQISATLNAGSWYLNTNATLSEVATAAQGAAAPGLLKVIAGKEYGSGNIFALSTDASGFLNVNAFNPSVGSNGALAKTSSTLMGVSDGTNQQQLIAPISLGDGVNGNNSIAGVQYLYNGATFDRARGDLTNGAWVNVKTSVLPTGASTSANQTTGNTSLSSIDGKLTGVATAANQTTGNTSLSSIDGKLTTTVNGLKVDGSGVTQPVSAASLPLPTGAATSALQTTGNTTLSTISGQLPATLGAKTTANSLAVNIASDQTVPVSAATLPLPTGAATETSLSGLNGKVADDFGVSTGAVRTAAQIGNATGAAAFGSGTTSAQTLRVVLPTDQAAIQTKAAVNSTGSGAAGTVTTGTVTLTAPANAAGFILMNADTSTANIRWAIGRTPSATVGQQLQPGRDTGYVPAGANVVIIAESGTQNYDIQWVSQ